MEWQLKCEGWFAGVCSWLLIAKPGALGSVCPEPARVLTFIFLKKGTQLPQQVSILTIFSYFFNFICQHRSVSF